MTAHFQNLVQRCRKDRRLAVMLALLVVGLLLWGRLLLQSAWPQTATAEPAASVAQAGVEREDAGAARQARGPARPVVEVTLPAYLSRDLFNFPTDGAAWARAGKNEPDENGEEKSLPDRSDEQLRSATVRKAAENLQLRSVMNGEMPSAVINGRVLRPGQQIQGFTLLEVAQRHVLLEQQGVIVRLQM